MPKILSPAEIKRRLTKLYNYEHNLYPAARARIAKLEIQNKQQADTIAELKEKDSEKDELIQKLMLQVEALNVKVFGKQHRGSDSKPDNRDRVTSHKPKQRRDASSYRRQLPDESEITDRQYHPIDTSNSSPHYGHALSKHKSVDYYEEDIIPPEEVRLKTVTKHTVQMAYCLDCQQWLYGQDIPKQKVVLGDNLPMLVSFLNTVGRLSYQQIAEHIELFYRIRLGDGLITSMLEKQAAKLRPAYEKLIESILVQKGVHFDESSWKMLIERLGHYVWVMTGTENRDAAFFFGQSRGKGVLTDKLLASLKRTSQKIIGISDDYRAYKSVEQFLEHALCWAHPNRKLRDLAESKTLAEAKRLHCRSVYEQFKTLYGAVIDLWLADVSPIERSKQTKLLKISFKNIAKAHDKDPPELATYKQSLRSNYKAYFVCLKYPGIIPPDNNKAERALRHLVIKRKACFGSKTQKGAEVLSVLYSVLLSLHWRKPDNYFAEYRELLETSA